MTKMSSLSARGPQPGEGPYRSVEMSEELCLPPGTCLKEEENPCGHIVLDEDKMLK